MSAEGCLRILQTYRRIAMVGLFGESDAPKPFRRDLHAVEGYEIMPVNRAKRGF